VEAAVDVEPVRVVESDRIDHHCVAFPVSGALWRCERIGIKHYSPPWKGGVDARSRKYREATLLRADGVVRSAKSLGLKSFAELLLRLRPIGLALRATPSAALRRLRDILLMPQTPLLFKEGNVSALKQSANSFTRSDALGNGLFMTFSW